MLTGVLDLDGEALSDCRVLLISEDMNDLLASTTTDDEGIFRFPTSNAVTNAVILAKVQRKILSIGHRFIDISLKGFGPYRLSFDTASPAFHTISGRIMSNEGWPPYLLLHVNPVHVAGVPTPLEKFFNTVDDEVVEAWFFQQRLEGDNFKLRLQKGSYRIDVHYFNKSQAEMITRESQNYSMREIFVEGNGTTEIDAPFASYLLNVEADRILNIVIAAATQE